MGQGPEATNGRVSGDEADRSTFKGEGGGRKTLIDAVRNFDVALL